MLHELVLRKKSGGDHIAEGAVSDLPPHLVRTSGSVRSPCCTGIHLGPDPSVILCYSSSREAPGESHCCRRCNFPPASSKPSARFRSSLAVLPAQRFTTVTTPQLVTRKRLVLLRPHRSRLPSAVGIGFPFLARTLQMVGAARLG